MSKQVSWVIDCLSCQSREHYPSYDERQLALRVDHADCAYDLFREWWP